jgi:hypothetical protein
MATAWRCLALALLMLCVWPAYAAPTAAEKETARSLVHAGRQKMKDGEARAALDDFSAAHAIMNVPTTGREVGRAQMELGMLLEARDTFLTVVRMPVERREGAAFRAARKEAKELADALAPRIPSVRISVEGDAAKGATVFIDDEEVPEESIGVAFKVNPGEHEFIARNGELEQAVTLEIAEGETEDVTLRLEHPPVVVEESDPTMTILTASAFGLAGVAVIVGSVTGILSIDGVADVGRRCTLGRCPPETHADIDKAERLGTISTVGFIVAGVAAAGGVVGLTLILVSDGEPEGQPDVALHFGPGHLELKVGF